MDFLTFVCPVPKEMKVLVDGCLHVRVHGEVEKCACVRVWG